MRCTPEVCEFWRRYLPVGRTFDVFEGNRLFIGQIHTYPENDINGVVSRTKTILDSVIDNVNVKPSDCCVLIHSPALNLIQIRTGILDQLGYNDFNIPDPFPIYRLRLADDKETSLVFISELLQTNKSSVESFIKSNESFTTNFPFHSFFIKILHPIKFENFFELFF